LIDYGKIAIFYFALGTFFFLGKNVVATKPMLSNSELREIRSLERIEKDAYVMSMAPYYSPWLYGYSKQKVVAPGLFEYDTRWKEDEWYKFWKENNPELRHQLLNRYQKPLYIFVGEKQKNLAEQFDQDPKLEKHSQYIYRYE